MSEKKDVLIIGASSGIGLSLAKQLKIKGINVHTASRHQSDELKDLGLPFQNLDVTDKEIKLDNLPEKLDGLVYCPGTINLKPFRSLRDEEILNDFEVNAHGALRVIKAAYGSLRKAENASIVLFSTVAVQTGMPFHSSVAMAKGAVEGLTRSLAAELAPRIRVNAVAPSLTDTPLASKLLSNEDKKEASNKRHPLNRYGQPEELAAVADFLLSDQAGWMTGQVIGMDGGISAVRGL
jgi:NAD(P)-dependent dehydrogenase (short-subunit alcohol dehydrogenase family)